MSLVTILDFLFNNREFIYADFSFNNHEFIYAFQSGKLESSSLTQPEIAVISLGHLT